MRHGGSHVRRLAVTLAVASGVLAWVPAAGAAPRVTSGHHFSVGAKSATVGKGKLVLSGVEKRGLLEHLRRESAKPMTVRELLAQWKSVGSRPYLSVTHGSGELELHVAGRPSYDAKHRRLTIPVRERGKPTRLRNARVVLAHPKAATTGLLSQSRDYGPFTFALTYPTDHSRVSIAIQFEGTSTIHLTDLDASHTGESFDFVISRDTYVQGGLTFAPGSGVVFLVAGFSAAGNQAYVSGALATLD